MLIGTHIERLAAVRERINAAARRAGRDPASITLVAVSKTQPASAIEAVRALGVTDFGESYVQEGVAKIAALSSALSSDRASDRAPVSGLCWHFIGHLQSNKTRGVAEHFHWAHGVDRVAIAQRLNAQRPVHASPLNVCLQVRLGDEATKSGVNPDEVSALAAQVAEFDRLRLRGLMCLPPPSEVMDEQRHWFRQLRQLLERLNAEGHQLDTLSMGMSGDFEVAIEEGATHVRVGTAIFGERL